MAEPRAASDRLSELRARIEAVVGAKGLVADATEIAPLLIEPRGLYRSSAPFVVKPASTQEVAKVVRLCAEAKIPIVPQGGNTGLVGGAVAGEHGEVILNLARMNRIRAVDALNHTITVEAGCILKQVQEAADSVDRLLPLSLGAEGSCQIGGNLSTNAGGIHVLRYGTMRDLVLGLEVVLPDGRVWDGLRRLRKDNTGYDLKHLFIGAEGTLGVITAAVLKLFAKPREKASAFAAVRDVAAAVEILARARTDCGESVTACELIPRIGLDFALAHVPGTLDPLATRHEWYVLIEVAGGGESGGLAGILEDMMATAYDDGLVRDAALAASEAQAAAFWLIREALVEAQKYEGGSIKHDVAVPVSKVPAFIARATEAASAMVAGIRPVPFGHLGDGNIHFNLSQPEGADKDAFLVRWDEVSRAVHDIVHALGGSISAEHGIGRLRICENERFKSEVELDLMRRVKVAFDPHNLMNPGKVLR